MLEGNSKHMANGEPSLFHRCAGKRRKSDNIARSINVWNVCLEELIHSQSAAQISSQPRGFQSELVAIGLATDGVDQSVSVRPLATFQVGKDQIASRVDPNSHYLFP